MVAAQGERTGPEGPGDFAGDEFDFLRSESRTRLATRVITIPKRVDLYFSGRAPPGLGPQSLNVKAILPLFSRVIVAL